MTEDSLGYLRIVFEDESWVTIGTHSSTNARQLCEQIAKKRNIRFNDENTFALFACEFSDERTTIALFINLSAVRICIRANRSKLNLV